MDWPGQVKQRLRELNKSQRWLAAEVGMTEANVSKFLRGQRRVRSDTMAMIADAVGLDLMVPPAARGSGRGSR